MALARQARHPRSGRSGKTNDRPMETNPQSTTGKVILLADDDDLVRSLVRLTLEDREYTFLEAENGFEALELCRRESPDLAILDWQMPEITGVDVAEALQSDPLTAHIPTILLTANGSDSHIEQGYQVGARAFLVKPFSPLELVRAVEDVLGSG